MNNKQHVNEKIQEHLQRLERLQNYLKADPDNEMLRVDTFDTAMFAGALQPAEFLAEDALSRGLDANAWRFRLGNVKLAQKRWDEAQSLFEQVQNATGLHPALSHNLAYIRFMQAEYGDCCEVLRPWMDDTKEPRAHLELATLWLRAMHRLNHLDEAWQWVSKQLAQADLAPAVAGVASLIALDAGHLPQALRLAEQALAGDAGQMEALVTRASIALAQKDPVLARNLALRAVELNPEDGRVWSVLGLADMLDVKLDLARQHLEKAVAFMPKHIGTWLSLGWVDVLQKELSKARTHFERALSLDRNFGESHGALAVVFAMQGERSSAEQYINLALKLDRESLSARYAQAILNGEASDPQTLQRLIQRLF